VAGLERPAIKINNGESYRAGSSSNGIALGRVLDKLRQMGELENTIVIVTSDNGASAEGGKWIGCI
jgi:arylsulfatase